MSIPTTDAYVVTDLPIRWHRDLDCDWLEVEDDDDDYDDYGDYGEIACSGCDACSASGTWSEAESDDGDDDDDDDADSNIGEYASFGHHVTYTDVSPYSDGSLRIHGTGNGILVNGTPFASNWVHTSANSVHVDGNFSNVGNLEIRGPYCNVSIINGRR